MHTLSYFLAAIRPVGDYATDLATDSVFCGRPPGDIVFSVVCGDFEICLLTSRTTGVVSSDVDGGVILVLHGELYSGSGPTSAEGCLEAYMQRGLSFLPDLHGSFALTVIDGRQGRVFLATDLLNSRKLFFGKHRGLAWISTMHAFHLHPCSGRPDPAGVAHCLVNGIPLNGLTPFEGVRVLERASIHEIRGLDMKSESYWQYSPRPRTDRLEGAFKKDVQDTLVAAIGRRVSQDEPAVLSLSGGYDSTAVLGTLRHLQVTDVRCITYKIPGEGDLGDAGVAGKMATIAGYPHTEIEAYRDDVAAVIAENVRWGNGLTRLVVETDAWRSLRECLPSDRRTTFWVADECFGMVPSHTLLDDADVLNSLAFADWSSLGPLTALFPRTVTSLLGGALRADLDSMLERNRAIQDPYVLRECLYLEQRLPRILSWREAYAGSCGEVRIPLIDREVLELRQQLPQHMKLERRLYKETVTELFPDLFAIGRAVGPGWFAGNWCREAVRTQSDRLARMVRANASPLDEYLPPEMLLRVIGQEARRAAAIRRLAWRARRGLRNRLPLIGRPGVENGRPRRPTVDSAVFLLRAITLREVFRSRAKNAAARGAQAERIGPRLA